MPRIILVGFSKQQYSVNLLYQFADTEQKYQINPQLCCGTFGLLHTAVFNLWSASSAGELEIFSRHITFRISFRSDCTVIIGFAADDAELGH
jgi:hypothetical protein